LLEVSSRYSVSDSLWNPQFYCKRITLVLFLACQCSPVGAGAVHLPALFGALLLGRKTMTTLDPNQLRRFLEGARKIQTIQCRNKLRRLRQGVSVLREQLLEDPPNLCALFTGGSLYAGLFDATCFDPAPRPKQYPQSRPRQGIPRYIRRQVLAVGQCLHCGSTKNLSVDHIHPWSRGGSNDPSNLQCLCMPCNHEKHAKRDWPI
jgi:hypothetical protein